MTTPSNVTQHETSPRATELLNEVWGGRLHDPYPAYTELREMGDGVHWAEQLQGYVVCRYADVRQIGTDPTTFSSDTFFGSAASWHDGDNPEHVRFIDAASRLFMFSDPPTHTRIRSTFRHAFTPQAIESWRPRVERITDELIGRYEQGVEFNIMPGFAADVPVAVIADLLGVPAEMRGEFRRWSYAYASTFDPVIQGPARDQAIVDSLELFDYLDGLVTQRRAVPQDDLITTVIETETVAGDHLVDGETVAQLALLLVAGNETTTTTIGTGLTLLFENPEALDALRLDPSLIPDAVEEMLRFDPPLHFVQRKVTRDTIVGDHHIPAGTMLFPCPPAANRDPRRFDDPEKFRLGRKDNKHLAFFHGIHFCVGAPLARMETQVIFSHILNRFPDIRPGKEPAERRASNSVAKGWISRPVIL